MWILEEVLGGFMDFERHCMMVGKDVKRVKRTLLSFFPISTREKGGWMIVHKISVRNPWFDRIADGTKTIEGRVHAGIYAAVVVDDILEITNDNDPRRVVKAKVLSIHQVRN